jgi:hypothetical protein
MADLSSLKQRVELVDLRLKTAHGARERESAALMETWEQIRERFVEQTADIVQLRDRISELEDARDELLQMVHGLLGAVENGLEKMSDESVPQIRTMAANLLMDNNARTAPVAAPTDTISSEPARLDDASETEYTVPRNSVPEDFVPENTNFHDALLATIEQSIEDVRGQDSVDSPRDQDNSTERFESDVIRDAASPGIRDLVARIETAVGPELIEPLADRNNNGSVEDLYEEGDELSRDLQEIEALRGELHGLRQRISSGTM